MTDRQQMPCPDCGSPVRPEVDQLCPNCGYPLMFLRQPAEDNARAVPRSPVADDDRTGVHGGGPHRGDTRTFQTGTYGKVGPPPQPAATGGPGQCPGCGYPNEAVRIRCERCGRELRAARPQAVRLGPPPVEAPRRRWLVVLLIVLAVLAVLSIASALVAYFWF